MLLEKFLYNRLYLIIICVILEGMAGAAFSLSNGHYMRHIGDGVQNSFEQPALLAWTCGGIAGVSLLDGQIQHHFTGRLLPKQVSFAADWYGKGVDWALGNSYILGDYLAGGHSQTEMRDRLQVFNEAWMVNLAAPDILKTVVRRERPGGQNNFSFPSGHSSGAFCVAAALQEMYGFRAGAPAFTLATITGIQRIHANKHWFSDVLTGALLGVCIGHGFAELVKEDETNRDDNSFYLSVAWSF